MEQQNQQPLNFLSNPKLPLIVVAVVIILAVAGILLLWRIMLPSIETAENLPKELTVCTQDRDCVLVDYYNCCVPPQRAINKEYAEEYYRHPEWQYPSEERLDFCSRVFCAPPKSYETARCEQNQCVGVGKEESSIDTPGWQTYRNEEFGFEVRYPSDGEISEPTSSWPFVLIKIEDIGEMIIAPKEKFPRGYEGQDGFSFEGGEILFADGKARKNSILFEGKATEFFINNFEGIPSFSWSQDSEILVRLYHRGEIISVEEKLQIFDQILSTFRFVDE